MAKSSKVIEKEPKCKLMHLGSEQRGIYANKKLNSLS